MFSRLLRWGADPLRELFGGTVTTLFLYFGDMSTLASPIQDAPATFSSIVYCGAFP